MDKRLPRIDGVTASESDYANLAYAGEIGVGGLKVSCDKEHLRPRVSMRFTMETVRLVDGKILFNCHAAADYISCADAADWHRS